MQTTMAAEDIKMTLPELLDSLTPGDEVILTRHQQPVAKLVPPQQNLWATFLLILVGFPGNPGAWLVWMARRFGIGIEGRWESAEISALSCSTPGSVHRGSNEIRGKQGRNREEGRKRGCGGGNWGLWFLPRLSNSYPQILRESPKDNLPERKKRLQPGPNFSLPRRIASSPRPEQRRRSTSAGGHGIGLWSALILKLTKVITGHPYGTRPMALPPDGKTLASADVDRTVKLGDIATGEKLLALGRFTGTVWILRFSQDGNVLATMGSKAPREAHWELFLWRTAEHETRAATSGGGVVRSC